MVNSTRYWTPLTRRYLSMAVMRMDGNMHYVTLGESACRYVHQCSAAQVARALHLAWQQLTSPERAYAE